MASIIQVGTAAMGGYQAPDSYQRGFIMAALGKMRFRQFAKVLTNFSMNMGKNIIRRKWSDFASVGSEVAETATMPLGTATCGTSSIAVSERGQAIDHSRLAQLTMDQSVEEICKTILARDSAKSLNNLAEAAFDECNYRYSGTATNGGVWSTDGTTTGSGASKLNTYHIGVISDYMQDTLKIPPFDSQGNYVGICTGKAIRNIKDDSTIESWRQYADPESFMSGELGRVEGFRLVKDNEAAGFDGTIGASNISGEAYFFGADPIEEAIVQAEEVRMDNSDYQRIMGLAWYYIGGIGKSGLEHIVKWASADA